MIAIKLDAVEVQWAGLVRAVVRSAFQRQGLQFDFKIYRDLNISKRS